MADDEYPWDLTEAAITITFGDRAENGPGMERLGEPAAEGLTPGELAAAAEAFTALGARCELVDLVVKGGVFGGRADPACVLVIRGGVDALLGPGGARTLRAEQIEMPSNGLPPDTKALFRGVVKNKLARHNLCFLDRSQPPNYAEGQGRIVAFEDVPTLGRLRDALAGPFGPKAARLPAEGNYYYAPTRCGVGFHGDGERRIVIAARFGPSIPLVYRWYLRGVEVGKPVRLELADGDMYAMSEKAVGWDWLRPSILTLRHAAGAPKYLRPTAKTPK